MCMVVDSDTCAELEATTDLGLGQMSLQQLDHMFQQDFFGTFVSYSTTFCDELGEGETTDDIDLSTLTKPIRNFYVKGDQVCDVETNQTVTNELPGVDSSRASIPLQGPGGRRLL